MNALSISRFTRATHWAGQGGYEGGLWGGQAIGGLPRGYGIHWQPAGRGKSMVVGPGLPATRFISIAWDRAYAEMDETMRVVNAAIARIVESTARTGGMYLAKHQAKMGWADSQGWENVGPSFDDARPATDYPQVSRTGTTLDSRIEYWNPRESLPTHPDFKWTEREIKIAERIPKGKATRIGDFMVTREYKIPSGLKLDWQYRGVAGTAAGKTFYIESMDPTVKFDMGAEDIRLKRAEGLMATGQVTGRLKGGSLLYLHATNNITPACHAGAVQGHNAFVASSEKWKASFRKHIVITFQATKSPVSRFKTGTAKPFDPLVHIDPYINVPGQPKIHGSGTSQIYSYSVYTMHPAATAHEFGLKGARLGGLEKQIFPKMRGLGTPSWRTKEFG